MRYQRSLAIAKRLRELLALIRRGTYSSPTIAEKLGVSEQTIYRDIVFLKHQGHPIRSVKVSTQWAYQFVGNRVAVRKNLGKRRA
jgi:predicted DNA-binding transcriptional regulator YafY